MFIELVDALRCPNDHEESWLVASAQRMEARHIVEGTLGCPLCRATYPIRRGVADFRRAPTLVPRSVAVPDAGEAERLAALLDLTDATGFAVLFGGRGAHGALLTSLVDTPLLLVDPPDDVYGAPGISVVRADDVLPLAAAAARATAIDAAAVARRAADAVRITRAGGRIVAPAELPVPAGVRELARDGALWVGERESSPLPLLALHVRRR